LADYISQILENHSIKILTLSFKQVKSMKDYSINLNN